MLTINRIGFILNSFLLPTLAVLIGGLVTYKVVGAVLTTPEIIDALVLMQQTGETEVLSYLAPRLALIFFASSILPYLLVKLMMWIFNNKEWRTDFKREWNMENK